MKKLFLVLFCICLTNEITLAQQGKYDMALSYGFYQAPAYKQTINKPFMAVSFDYRILERWTLSSGFLRGQFTYFEDWRSNIFSSTDYTPNAKGYESHLYFTVSYSAIHMRRFSTQIGLGIGRLTQTLQYDYLEPSTIHSPRGYGGNIFKAEESVNRVEVPFKLEAFYMLTGQIGLGIRTGTFLQSTWSFVGTYLGPQLRIRL